MDPAGVIAVKMVLSALLGVAIGTERAVVARQAAGPRTFALVALGACMFVVVGDTVNTQYLGYLNFDPMRMAAAIVQGVGFIGAGLIFLRGDSVHGVTTASGLWVAAALGVMVAFGMYGTAVFAAILTLLIFFGLWYFERAFKRWYDSNQKRIHD